MRGRGTIKSRQELVGITCKAVLSTSKVKPKDYLIPLPECQKHLSLVVPWYHALPVDAFFVIRGTLLRPEDRNTSDVLAH